MRLLLLALAALAAARSVDAFPAGDFTSAIMVHNGTSTRNLSLAEGHLLLSSEAATVCGYHPDTFATQRKLVLAYWAATDSGPLSFFLCNSGQFMHNFWLITCPRPLETRDGSDARKEGCGCQLPDPGFRKCDTSDYGFTATTEIIPGYWYYMLVQSNPPDTGEDSVRAFTVSAGPPPPPPVAAADADDSSASDPGSSSAAATVTTVAASNNKSSAEKVDGVVSAEPPSQADEAPAGSEQMATELCGSGQDAPCYSSSEECGQNGSARAAMCAVTV